MGDEAFLRAQEEIVVLRRKVAVREEMNAEIDGRREEATGRWQILVNAVGGAFNNGLVPGGDEDSVQWARRVIKEGGAEIDRLKAENERLREAGQSVAVTAKHAREDMAAENERLRGERTQARREVFHEANERHIEKVESVLDAANEMDEYGQEMANAARSKAAALCRAYAEANKDNQIAFAACCDLAAAIEQQDQEP